eukprot:TRINITY_DN14413_c0_g1_i1.p2 TRINITY_DN14413_c0_g1~~TRINITY_DN14413_c0_g1_i1.p2  ORF type:complete len:160 (-),score=23.28 TRINITY_DN14413_c0_g1_i1:348-827(-)
MHCCIKAHRHGASRLASAARALKGVNKCGSAPSDSITHVRELRTLETMRDCLEDAALGASVEPGAAAIAAMRQMQPAPAKTEAPLLSRILRDAILEQRITHIDRALKELTMKLSTVPSGPRREALRAHVAVMYQQREEVNQTVDELEELLDHEQHEQST